MGIPIGGSSIPIEDVASSRQIRREARRQRRAERRSNRFRKDADYNATDAAIKTGIPTDKTDLVFDYQGRAYDKNDPNLSGAMADSFRQSQEDEARNAYLNADSVKTENYWVKTDGNGRMTSMGMDANGRRQKPGFTPNDLYWSNTFGWYDENDSAGTARNGWWGNLLDAHASRISGYNDNPQTQPVLHEFDEKLGSKATQPDKSRNPVSPASAIKADDRGTSNYVQKQEPRSKRDTLLMHNDAATDYFLHDSILTGKSKGVSEGESGEMVGRSLLYSAKGTPWENQDPVVYGFDVIIDAISSPLLNGAVDEFIDMYPNVSEIQSRRRVLFDFKKQLQKLFKTRGQINFRQQERDLYQNETLYSDYQNNDLADYANQPNPQGSNTFWRGKKAYLAHYLHKIEGLHKLNVSNLGETKKYLSDWQKDFVKMTFHEDVSGTMAALMHTYNLLYWSKPNGKHMIPENLLRFNCEIIVSEVRNFNRVRHAVGDQNLQILKDNVSRYRYSLRECQFYFDTPSHDDAIDYSQSGGAYGGYTVNMDYKYTFLKYEKWVSDPKKFGQYVAYNNGAIWRLGNKGERSQRQREAAAEGGDTGTIRDTSNPRFYTRGTNSLGQDGVKAPIELMNYRYVPVQEDIVTVFDTVDHNGNFKFNYDGYEDPEQIAAAGEGDPPGIVGVTIPLAKDDDDTFESKIKSRSKGALERFKTKSKQVGKRILKESYMVPWREIKAQVGIRTQLLLDTVERMKNLAGFGGLGTDPINVYPKPYTPVGMGIFFDVRNELYNFWAEEISAIQAGASSIINPFNSPGIEGIMPDKLKKANAPSVWFNPLNMLLKKFSGLPSVMQSGINDNMMQDMNAAFSTVGLGKNQPTSGDNLIDILNKSANFKPSDEGDGTANSYKAYDYQIAKPGQKGLGGLYAQGVKADSSLKDILNTTANFKPSDEGDGTAGSYTAYDPQEAKTGTNYPSTSPKGVGFGPDSSKKSTDTLKDILNTTANFKPKDEGNITPFGVVPDSYIAYDYQAAKQGTNYPGGGQPKGFGRDTSKKSTDTLKNILETSANFKPSDEGDGTAGSYTAYDYQIAKPGQNGLGGLYGQGVKAQSSLDDILNSGALFKPIDEGVFKNKKVGQYIPKDPNVGFGGSGVDPNSDNVKSSGTLEDIVKNNTKWPYPVNNKKFP